jgi:hypothetical protein
MFARMQGSASYVGKIITSITLWTQEAKALQQALIWTGLFVEGPLGEGKWTRSVLQ